MPFPMPMLYNIHHNALIRLGIQPLTALSRRHLSIFIPMLYNIHQNLSSCLKNSSLQTSFLEHRIIFITMLYNIHQNLPTHLRAPVLRSNPLPFVLPHLQLATIPVWQRSQRQQEPNSVIAKIQRAAEMSFCCSFLFVFSLQILQSPGIAASRHHSL